MAKAPAFQWYPKDCDTDEEVKAMNDREFGFYMRCLNHAWLNNGLPSDLGEVARIMHRSRHYVEDVWKRVGKKFRLEGDRLVNGKQEEQRQAVREFKDGKAAELGRRGGKAKWTLRERDDPDRINAQSRHERLKAARLLGTHTEDEWAQLLNAVGGCARCGSKDNIQKDHVQLIRNGGSDSVANLQPLCKSCNCAKGPDETDFVSRELRLALGHISSSDTPDEKHALSGSPSATASASPSATAVATEQNGNGNHGVPISREEWPEVTRVIQERFPSADGVFILRIVQNSIQGAISDGIDPALVTDEILRQAVLASYKTDNVKRAGLLLTTVPQIIRSWGKSNG